MDEESRELSRIAREIEDVAKGMGLDFYPVHFEICPPETLYTFGAYGMPVRFTHWSFGKAFYRLKMQYDLNLSRIYELVINSDPAYAFLLEGNKLVQNKLVIGHVYAHVDFFKNNHYFSRTPKDMVERMAAHAEQIREYETRYGRDKVERTLDAVLSIQEHVDFRSHIARRPENKGKSPKASRTRSPFLEKYADLFPEDPMKEVKDAGSRREAEDLVGYLIMRAPRIEPWQRDILSMVRAESLYFYPQIETKIINEGWASFWHAKIMREIQLSAGESLDFAVMHSQVLQPSRYSLNPYYLGYKIWESLEKEKGLDTLFELRETENDLSFVRNYLDRELVEELNLFNFRKVGAHWQVTDTDWEKVRDNLVQGLVHGGHPRMVVSDGDYEGRGALKIRHCHEGLDLDLVYLEKTLAHVQFLWQKPVYLETVLDGKKVLFECDNGLVTRHQTGEEGEKKV
ncbi:Sporulation stage V, protein R [Acididesulfobacillus acetoxydans]|uniref:Sporulation stage V, protein R n=1 Tax=Acididesulfobacillus acetoxydans TaxID=1561005 RepID=A0A8S0W329_9FIRM|nr:SpoVR family protein [Acididesulfobacillus acetoxydans]CAA7601248.1 Sporulation stage V, protein R [Acididesulfobacillus acetoxydans]CEJ08473.1 Stage V sporulation protein R [Acididesulfobacillus acetoxydans]